ncbi:MAG: spore germination protein [Caldibacillus debilis]|uniref:Spore germination protein n=2 Tax=Caldibacillus debilis TaxID=301148 RepID=A0A3E0K5X5_9BACI|nr:MAG: spore germination protein [Caldibacillus debilis]
MALWSAFFNKLIKDKQRKPNGMKNGPARSGRADGLEKKYLDKRLEANIQMIKETTGNSSDIIIRVLEAGKGSHFPFQAAVVMADGLSDNATVSEFIIESLLNEQHFEDIPKEEVLTVLEKKILSVTNVKVIKEWNELFNSLLSGETVVLVDGTDQALGAGTRGGKAREVTEPNTEVSIRGPKESFTESIRDNTALIRRRICNPNLWLESMKIGKETKTNVGIMYIKGIANDDIIEEVKTRLRRIDTDSILDSGIIEQFIEDETFSVFPTIFYSERPDTIAANLLEGRIAIIIDGSPFVLTVPALFIEFFQTADDYYTRVDISNAIRMLRILVFFVSMIAPATYVALTNFHQEMVPTQLIITIAAQREAIPFPAIVEVVLMELTFEILREAGLRLPKTIGQAVSIVGALVIGQAAVQAGLVSPMMVIVVAVTGIASFATPSFSIAISARLIRFALMIISSIIGIYGIIIGVMFITIHLCSLRSFGVPYMAPFAPLIVKNLGDTVIRMPAWKKDIRPKLISQNNIERTGQDQGPKPPDKKDEQPR